MSSDKTHAHERAFTASLTVNDVRRRLIRTVLFNNIFVKVPVSPFAIWSKNKTNKKTKKNIKFKGKVWLSHSKIEANYTNFIHKPYDNYRYVLYNFIDNIFFQ